MSRRDNQSWPVRGVPREVLNRVEVLARQRRTTPNHIALELVRGYARGELTPAAAPPPFDANRQAAAPYGDDTAPLSVSGVPQDVFGDFMSRAKREGWHSKNALIVELLRDAATTPA